jgi:hypothetical protein
MKRVIDKIKLAVGKVFGGILEFIIDNADVAIKVTNIVKEVINNPLVDYTVALTPTKRDDVLLFKAKQLAPMILTKLAFAMGIAKEAELSGDPLIVTGKVFEIVRQSIPLEGRAIFYRELSGKIALALADGKITEGEIIGILQLKYHKVI